MLAALSNFNRKLQEAAPLSAGNKLVIDSNSSLCFPIESELDFDMFGSHREA
uniref:Signal transducer n=1 Tax=Solanum tuberosum TaxID=4113 RepID=M1AH28_SOLTU